ncbi:MAG: hypothetical protein Q8L29_00705 [archaeon]|nr:hypothetical protein [archaeon]
MEEEIKKEEQKEKIEEIKEEKIDKTLLELGEYRMFGPDNGDILIDRIELKSATGANRIWRIKSLDKKQIVLEVVKFG